MNDSLAGSCPASSDAFDPDIAGIGLVMSFYATAIIAIFSVLAAYLMGSLPRARYGDVDLLLIDFIRRWSPWRYSRFDTRTAIQRAQRFEECFEKLFVNLADQQLVTSLAILIAACSKWETISFYSLEMSWTLATTSLVTHMTAIRYCPKYLRDNPRLGLARAGAVFIVLAGFISLAIILEYASLQASELAVGVDGYSAAAIAWKLQLACIFSHQIQTPPTLVRDLFWSIAALTYYINILSKLYSRTGKIHPFSFVYRTLLRRLRPAHSNFDGFRHLCKSRLKWISSVIPQPLQGVCSCLAEMEAAYFAIKTSVSADIPWLFFVLVYCIAQLKTVWLDSDSPFWDQASNSTSLGFGQLMALILLAVPLLAGVESFLSAWPTATEVATTTMESRQDNVEAGLANENVLAIVLHARDPPTRNEHPPDTEMAASHNERNLDIQSIPNQLLSVKTDENTTAASSQPGLDNVLDRRWFRNFLYLLCGWNMAVLIYAAIITGGPWEGEDINLSAIILIASLFGWEVLLEVCSLSYVVWQELVGHVQKVGKKAKAKSKRTLVTLQQRGLLICCLSWPAFSINVLKP